MAIRVPVTQIQQLPTRPDAMPVVQVQPSGVEQLKTGLDKLNQGLSRLEATQFESEMADKRQADEARVEAFHADAAAMRTEILKGVLQRESESAVGVQQWARQRMTDYLEKAYEPLANQTQVSKAQRLGAALVEELDKAAMTHEFEQLNRASIEKHQAVVDQAVSDGINFPALREGALDTVKGSTQMFAWNHNKSEEWTKDKTLEATTRIHLGVAENLVHEKKFLEAKQYVDANIKEIDGEKLAKSSILNQVNAGKDEQLARNELNAYGDKPPAQIFEDMLRRSQLDPSDKKFLPAPVLNLMQQRLEGQTSFRYQLQERDHAAAFEAFRSRLFGTGVTNIDGIRGTGWEFFSEADPDFVKLDDHSKNSIRALVDIDKKQTMQLEAEEIRHRQAKDNDAVRMFHEISIEDRAAANIERDWVQRVGSVSGLDHLRAIRDSARDVITNKLLPQRREAEQIIKTEAMKTPGIHPDVNKQNYNAFLSAVLGEWDKEVKNGKRPTREQVYKWMGDYMQVGNGKVWDILTSLPLVPRRFFSTPRYKFTPGEKFYSAGEEYQPAGYYDVRSNTPVSALPSWASEPQPNQTPIGYANSTNEMDARIVVDIRNHLAQSNPQYRQLGVPDSAITQYYNQMLRDGVQIQTMIQNFENRRRQKAR